MKSTKSTKQSNKFKSRAVSIVVCAILIICAVLSFGLFGMPKLNSAAADEPAAKTVNGIRFVQVAAGDDFAIGLTYDGDLYGWSLDPERKGSTRLQAQSWQTEDDHTLGQYYAERPIKIDFDFRKGPGTGENALLWNNTGENGYHETKDVTDRIKKIVATRHTAAFLTVNGYVYTWGKDTYLNDGEVITLEGAQYGDIVAGNPHYLLLREPESDKPWYTPYIIDYNYYTTNSDAGVTRDSMDFLRNVSGSTLSNADIAAGEYNYIFTGTKNYNNNDYTMSYVWGSALYSTVQVDMSLIYDYTSRTSYDLNNALRIGVLERRTVSATLSGSTVRNPVAGGYNVGFNRNTAENGMTSLQLRGRNFLSSQDGSTIINTVNAVAAGGATAMSDIIYAQGDYNGGVPNGLIGGAGALGGTSPHVGSYITLEGYYGRVPSNSASASITFAQNATNLAITNAYGGELATVIGENNAKSYLYSAERFGVSLGNDVGYGVTTIANGSGGVLYVWGDNENGQLSTASGVTGKYSQTPVAITSIDGIDKFVSVAAGKQLSANKKPFNATDTLTLNGNAVSGFNTDVKNGSEFITGVLNNEGRLVVWSDKKPTPQEIVYGDADTPTADNRFLAIYSGYGNNLFAITKVGKLVRITYENGGYNQTYYDDFVTFTKTTATNGTVNYSYSDINNWSVDSTNRIMFRSRVAPTAENNAPDLGEATVYVWNATTVAYDASLELNEEDPEYAENNARGQVTFQRRNNNSYVNTSDGAMLPLVDSNAIGDAYRILGVKNGDVYTGDDNKLTSGKFLTAATNNNGNYIVNNAVVTSFVPQFGYKVATGQNLANQPVTPLTEQQRKNMFDFDVVVDQEGNGIGFKIKPKMSSRGYNIVIDFYIARYSAAANFTTAGVDNGVYYDFKPCRVEFIVNDTASARTYNAYDSSNGNNSTVPLLDPNNEYNKYYSLAVQDVSTGMKELLTYLGVQQNAIDGLYDKIVANITGDDGSAVLDPGFPAKSKIAKGNLTYYLGDKVESRFYHDSYKYLFSDRDGDRMTISIPEGEANIMTGDPSYLSAVKATINTIHVTGIDTGLAFNGGDNGAEALAAMQSALLTDFRNVYGLYNIVLSVNHVNQSTKTIVLAFDYDVLTLNGEGSTGVVEYNNSGRVSSFNTTSGKNHLTANIATTVHSMSFAETDATHNFQPIAGIATRSVSTSNYITVFSTPSLRVNKGMGVDDGVVYDGDPDNANHEFTVEYTGALVVGDTIKINVGDFFINRNNRILFSFNDQVSSFTDYNNQFEDQTGYGGKPVILTNETLTVTPTTTQPIRLTLTVQRFRDTENKEKFINKSSTDNNPIYDEKITINFVFGGDSNPIRDYTFTKSSNNAENHKWLITQPKIMDLFGVVDNTEENETTYRFVSVAVTGLPSDEISRLEKQVNIVSTIKTTEDSKPSEQKRFTVMKNSNTTFTVTPLMSGTGTITFIATLYNKSLVFSFDVNIAAKTSVNQTINVIDDQYLYFNAIRGEVAKANSSYNEKGEYNPYIDVDKYNILTDDKAGAIYFTETPDAGIDNAVEMPPFINDVVFEGIRDNVPNIRIKSGNSTIDSAKTYYMHVRLTNTPNITSYDQAKEGSIVEAVYPIVSGKVRVPVEVTIDVRKIEEEIVQDKTVTANGNSFPGIRKTTNGKNGLEMVAYIKVQDLLDYLEREKASDYTIVIIRAADENTRNYFKYASYNADREVMITPLDNTPLDDDGFPDSFEIELSLTGDGGKSLSVTFDVAITGILTTLPAMQTENHPQYGNALGYGNILIYSALIVFGVLLIIFVIRFILYFKKRAKQRAIIKRNQELIRMRDRMHNKGATATREQVVKTRLKMDDPKYAKMLHDMKKARAEENGGLVVDDDAVANPKDKKKKKKKGGKKTVAELKAELEAKKAAFAAAQAQSAQPVDPFVQDVPVVDGGAFDATDAAYVSPDGGFGAPGGFDGMGADDFGSQSIDAGEIIFDATDVGDGV